MSDRPSPPGPTAAGPAGAGQTGAGSVRAVGTLVAIAVASLVLGVGTSVAQSSLPDALASFANSASGWTILCVALVMLARPGVAVGAACGVVGFACLVIGYTIASHARGHAYAPAPWLVVSVVAGPFVGAAAAAMRERPAVPAAVGAWLLAALLVADGLRGLTVLSDTTSPVYWVIVVVIGVLVALAGLGRLLRGRRPTRDEAGQKETP